MTNVHGEYIWYELMTTDPEGAKKFYDDVVGWNIGDKPDGDMDYRMIGAGDGFVGGMLGLTDAMISSGAFPTWLGYIGVDDVDAATKAAAESGATVIREPFDIPAGRISMISDPQGATVYLMRGSVEGGTSTAFVGNDGVNGHCNWNELVTTDSAAAIEFYTKNFNWGLPEPMDMGAMGKYHFISVADTQIGAICGPMPDTPAAKWNYYFRVPSIEAAVEKVKSGGGSISMGPMEVPGGSWIIIGDDPQGATFCLVGDK